MASALHWILPRLLGLMVWYFWENVTTKLLLLHPSQLFSTFPSNATNPLNTGSKFKGRTDPRPAKSFHPWWLYTSILSKLFEKDFHGLIMDHLTEHSSLSNIQWGFQKGKSTVSAFLFTTDSWSKHFEVIALKLYFLILKWRIDGVQHLPLLSKLQQFNLIPNIVSWVLNYLAGRKQCVVVNGVSLVQFWSTMVTRGLLPSLFSR